jgi:hypothetical protein
MVLDQLPAQFKAVMKRMEKMMRPLYLEHRQLHKLLQDCLGHLVRKQSTTPFLAALLEWTLECSTFHVLLSDGALELAPTLLKLVTRLVTMAGSADALGLLICKRLPDTISKWFSHPSLWKHIDALLSAHQPQDAKHLEDSQTDDLPARPSGGIAAIPVTRLEHVIFQNACIALNEQLSLYRPYKPGGLLSRPFSSENLAKTRAIAPHAERPAGSADGIDMAAAHDAIIDDFITDGNPDICRSIIKKSLMRRVHLDLSALLMRLHSFMVRTDDAFRLLLAAQIAFLTPFIKIDAKSVSKGRLRAFQAMPSSATPPARLSAFQKLPAIAHS